MGGRPAGAQGRGWGGVGSRGSDRRRDSGLPDTRLLVPNDWTHVRGPLAPRRGGGGQVCFRHGGCKQGVPPGGDFEEAVGHQSAGVRGGPGRDCPPPDCETRTATTQPRDASTFRGVKWRAKDLSYSFLSQMGTLNRDQEGRMFCEK